jgi:glutamate N-acetyltransferase / amino-acid N-acetyltransferase
MGKKDDRPKGKAGKKAENRKAEKKDRKAAAGRGKAASSRGGAAAVSPLAPPGGFPDLPAVAGVRFAAAEAGVRYAGRLDVMLAEIAAGASVAGVFTRSATRAAPVLWCEECLASLAKEPRSEAGFAILVNSGNANAFTGAVGRAGVSATVEAVADALDLPGGHVLVASTGVIGEPLPAGRITDAVDGLVAGLDAGGIERAARAIMTTDTYPKGAAATVELDGVEVSIAGIAKGSGMIAPDMATMLVFVFTDAAIDRRLLQGMVAKAADATFNCITVDGDTSTSDSLIVAATGKAAMKPIRHGADPRLGVFREALTGVMRDLAHQVVRDGEGATKFVEIAVTGAKSPGEARKAAMAIANSPLVKTAFAGEDPNWGRIVMAVGKSGVHAERDRLAIRFGDITVAENGLVADGYREADGAAYMKRAELKVAVDLGVGEAEATVWTCDLTKRYVEINADYRS